MVPVGSSVMLELVLASGDHVIAYPGIVVLRPDIDYTEAVNMLDACASVNVTCMCLCCFCFFQANCSVTIHAFEETGIATDAIYRLALVAEDFPHGLITVGNESFTRRRALSKVPLQV